MALIVIQGHRSARKQKLLRQSPHKNKTKQKKRTTTTTTTTKKQTNKQTKTVDMHSDIYKLIWFKLGIMIETIWILP